jgi:glycine/sarcosine N-methyltransferase
LTFYQSLTPYYDEIFPTNIKTLNFLVSNFKERGILLDVGAGTGNMALNLAKEGFNVIATEPEETMAKQIKEKAGNHSITVLTKTMQQIAEVEETFDGIYCIGNTLVHLNNMEEISEFVQQVYKKLNQAGVFVCQVVNFEKVLEKQVVTFPTIQKETFKFNRRYDLKGEKVLFTTTIETAEQTFSNTTSLYPVTSKQLLPALKNAGFQSVELFGNFEKESYTLNSAAVIVVAKK